MQVYVVSLKNSDRRETFSQLAEKYGLNFSFFDAVDGRKLPESCIDEINQGVLQAGLYQRKLAKGEIGCTLSHKAIYQQIVDNGGWAIILEDDISFDERLVSLSREINGLNQLNQQGIYVLGGDFSPFCTKKIHERKRTKQQVCDRVIFHKTVCSEKYIYGTWGYLIHASLAKKILEHAESIFLVADDWSYLTQAKILNGIYLTYIVRHPLDTVHSTIEQERALLRQQYLQPENKNIREKSPFRFIPKLIKSVKKARIIMKYF